MHFLKKLAGGTSSQTTSELHDAAQKGDLGRIRVLVQRGGVAGDVDKLDWMQRTPLHYAAAAGHDFIVGELLDRMAKTLLADQAGQTALHLAAQSGYRGIVHLLTGQRNRETAATKARLIGAVDQHGCDALMLAATMGRLEVVADLVALTTDGSELWRTSVDGHTALHFAALNGHLPIVQLLAARGANLDCRSGRAGAAPLHLAAFQGHMTTVEWLARNGAPLTSVDNDNMTPLDRARSAGQSAVAQLLKDMAAARTRSRASEGGPAPSGVAATDPPAAPNAGGASALPMGERMVDTGATLGMLPAVPPAAALYPKLPYDAPAYY